MKVAALTNTPLDPALGSGKTVLNWSQGLRDLGHSVTVFPPEKFYRPFPQGKGRTIKMRIDAMGLQKFLLEEGFDLIEFYGAEFGGLIERLAMVPRKNRPLLVSHTNGLELLAQSFPVHVQRVKKRSILYRALSKPWQSLIHKMDNNAFAKTDCFVAICKADTDFIVKNNFQPDRRCATIEPGIDSEYLMANWKQIKKQWIVTFGTWTDRKDPETTVAVVSKLLMNDSRLEYQVIGASNSAPAIIDSFPSHVRHRIHVHPRLSAGQVSEILSQSTVLLFPSLYEGYGMAIAEAMACGCAVVVTPTGFGADICDGLDGFVCSFRDTDGMAARCEQILADDHLRESLAKAGRERVQSLNWNHQVKRLETTYLHWLSSY